jgi:hypothetical protein
MTIDILYFILLSSPLSVYFMEAFKFAFLVCFNCIFKCYTFSSDKDETYTKKISKYIIKTSSFIQKKSIYESKEKPEGYFFSIKHMYFGKITTQTSQKEYEAKIETKIEFYGKLPFLVKKKLIVINDVNQENNNNINNNKIKLYMGCGGTEPSFREMEVYYNDVPYPFQQEIVENIINTMQKSKFNICRALICGNSNIGKSTIGRFLSIKLKGSLCFDIDLFSPGNSTLNIYERVQPTKENPLIIQIDEFDKLIDNIHNEKPPKTTHWLRNMVYNKQTYNTFMSEYITYLPNVIWLFTTNNNVNYFEKLDKSYVNSNRIDYKKEIF